MCFDSCSLSNVVQVICEGTKSNDSAVRKASFECFVKIAASYYDKLPPYIEAIFQLTSVAVRQDNEEVAKQAIEFWCSICEEETAIQEVDLPTTRQPSTQRP